MGEGLAAKLAQRAEGVFANHPLWQRRFQSTAGREHLLAVMRHWLAGVLAKEQPALFSDLPDSYKVGAPLPPQPLSRPKKNPQTESSGPAIQAFRPWLRTARGLTQTARRPLDNPTRQISPLFRLTG